MFDHHARTAEPSARAFEFKTPLPNIKSWGSPVDFSVTRGAGHLSPSFSLAISGFRPPPSRPQCCLQGIRAISPFVFFTGGPGRSALLFSFETFLSRSYFRKFLSVSHVSDSFRKLFFLTFSVFLSQQAWILGAPTETSFGTLPDSRWWSPTTRLGCPSLPRR